VVGLAVWAVTAACSGDGGRPAAVATTRGAATTAAEVATTTPGVGATSAAVTATPVTSSPPGTVEVAYRVERRVDDAATVGFEALVEQTLADPRGWTRAGFRLVRRDDAPYVIVLAEGSEVDRLCLPHDTYGEYSCQRSETVALNAERWREATPKWTGDLTAYRQMLVNHEFGHLLGQPHPRTQCPRAGRPAPLMAQQSTELDGCLPNPWPLGGEIAAAARHDRPLAPL